MRPGGGLNATCTTGPSNDSCRSGWSYAQLSRSRRPSSGSSEVCSRTSAPVWATCSRTFAKLSRGPHPAALTEGGLAPALRSLSRRSAVPVDLQLELDAERLAEPVEVAAYYTVSEALANTAKHAGATQVRVSVSHRGDVLELTVADDGRGGADPAAGSGLTGLADRLEALGGSVAIDSPPGTGTTVSARLPTSVAD